MTRLLQLAMLCTFALVFALPARAGLVSTDKVLPQSSQGQMTERERVNALIARPEVAKKLETLGVLPKDAQARVDALTDAEIASLAAKIDALPAGGMSDTNWLLIIIAILLVLIIAL